MSIGDAWATSYRNSRACAVIVLLALVIIGGLVAFHCRGSDSVVRVARERGTLVEVVNRASQYGIFMGVIELPDGERVQVQLRPPLPEDGAPILLRVEHLESGERRFSEVRTDREPGLGR
jgi:hypothetical protein